MDYTFVGYVVTAILSAWVGAFVVYKIGKDHYARAKFFMNCAESILKQTDYRNDQITTLRNERDRALSDVAKLERKLGQVVHAQEEFNRVANEALEAALARPQPQTILAPTVTDETTWKALLLACNEVAEFETTTEEGGWVQHFLDLAASNKDRPS